jgi:4-hydroxybenzoate polyprenyltransferase
MTNKLWLLVKTSRPVYWPAPILIFTVGFYLSNATISILSIFQFLMLFIPFNIFVYGINDVYDYESDKNNPRKGTAMGIKLHPKYHPFIRKTSYWMMGLLGVSALLTQNVENIVVMVLLLFFSYTYSAPPLRLKVHPPLDSISNSIIYFLGPAFLGYSFGGSILTVTPKVYFVTLCAVGAHAFSTIMDYKHDKKAGDRTFAVVFGKRVTASFAIGTLLVAFLFGNFTSLVINVYLVVCMVVFASIAITGSEKLSSILFQIFYVGSLITALIWFLV